MENLASNLPPPQKNFGSLKNHLIVHPQKKNFSAKVMAQKDRIHYLKSNCLKFSIA